MIEIVFREKGTKIRLTVAIGRTTLKVPGEMPQLEIDMYTRLAECIVAQLPDLKHTLRGTIKMAHGEYYWCSRKIMDGSTKS